MRELAVRFMHTLSSCRSSLSIQRVLGKNWHTYNLLPQGAYPPKRNEGILWTTPLRLLLQSLLLNQKCQISHV